MVVPSLLSSSQALAMAPLWNSKVVKGRSTLPSKSVKRNLRVKAFFLNSVDERIVKEALKEPVAFMGGMFAGFLRLDLNEDPLKEWISKTVEASGIAVEDISREEEEETPQQIEIE